MEQEFHRIKRLPPYVFAEVNALKAQARAEVRDGPPEHVTSRVPMLWLLSGKPGTGQSHVLRQVMELFRDVCG